MCGVKLSVRSWLLRHVRGILWGVFAAGYVSSFWGCYEFAYTLWERGAIGSPVWSGTFGFPVPHHYIIGFILTGVGVIGVEWRDRYERGKKEHHR